LLPADEYGERAVRSTCGLLTTVAYKLGQAPRHDTRLKAALPLPVRWCNGCATNLGLIGSSPEIETLARTVEDNGGVYFVRRFSGLYAPYWKHNARGVIAGLTRYVNKGHLARAVLEATAFQTREVVEAMEQDSGITLDVLRVDGGMVGQWAADAVSGRHPEPPRGKAPE
jgi:glycerol kinase